MPPKFSLNLLSKKKCEEIRKVFCMVCKAVFSIEHKGRSDIKQHMEKKIYTSALSSASKSDKTTSYFIKQGPAGLNNEGLKIAAEEGIDPVAIIWFYFIQNQLKVVCDTIKRIEVDNISACEVSEELEILCGKTLNFLTSSVNSMLLELETKNKYTKKQFIEQTNQFYGTFLLYIEKWGNSFEELKIFRWT
ncbi:hypothetical protein QTP88_017759 [Uroleucon formosanum]